jgi:integrase
MNKEMAYPPGMELHGSGWRITKRIPQELLPHYAPKKHLRHQTGEPDKKAAAVLAWRWLADLEEEFARIRQTGSKSRKTISPTEASRLAALMVRHVLAADEESRDSGAYADDDTYALSLSDLATMGAETREALSRRIYRGSLPLVVEEWLLHQGYDIPNDSEAFRALCLEFAKGRAEAIKGRQLRNSGEWVDTPPEPPVALPEPAGRAPKLSEVIQHFMGKQDETASMYKKYSVGTGLLLEVLGDRDVATIKQREIDDFFELLCKLPPRWGDKKRQLKVGVVELAAMSWPACVNKKTFEDGYMAAIRPFLRHARRVFGDQGFPAHLTTEGIKYSGDREGGENKQREFRLNELTRLFAGPEFEAFAKDPQQEHSYWMPLLGLYTGARVNEVCQLNPQCDIREEFGIWFLDITEDSDTDERVTKSVKNATSRRRVPIHSVLIELGFLKYVERMRNAGHALLFPQWPPTRGKASGKAEKWFRDLIRNTGLRDETEGARLVGFHAFRSTFLNRAMNLDIENAEWLTGHAEGQVSKIVRDYRGEAELAKKREVMERMQFDVSIPPRTN